MIMIYASIKRTMDDLSLITGAGRPDNINFGFAGKPHPDVKWRLVDMPSPHVLAGVPSNCSS